MEIAPTPPPGPPVMIWEPGQYHWNGNAYVWIPGHYVERRPEMRRWVQGHWDYRGGAWVWVPAHWSG